MLCLGLLENHGIFIKNDKYIIIVLILFVHIAFAQPKLAPQWIKGKGTAQGTDLIDMRYKAINAARADALKQAGIIFKRTDVALKKEMPHTLTDFYVYFAESMTRGLILDERNIKVSHPIPIDSADDGYGSLYKIDVSLEALIAIQNDEPDPIFDVKIYTDRDVYNENEPVNITVTSTYDGYLTIISIENDSLTVIFPNSLSPNNFVKSNDLFKFPPVNSYALTLQVIPGRKYSEITFVAIVTKEDVPFMPLEVAKYNGRYLKLKQAQLTNYAKWLYKIPINKRNSDIKVVYVISKE